MWVIDTGFYVCCIYRVWVNVYFNNVGICEDKFFYYIVCYDVICRNYFVRKCSVYFLYVFDKVFRIVVCDIDIDED